MNEAIERASFPPEETAARIDKHFAVTVFLWRVPETA